MTPSRPSDRAKAAQAAEARWGVAMAAAQRGNASAYHELLVELLVVVRRMVRARLSDPATAEDVVQTILLSLHRARHTYQPERPFGPWLRAIVRNAVTDSLRDRGRRARREVGIEEIETLAGPEVANVREQLELSPALSGALGELPFKQRQAVELIHVQGLSVAEAALSAGVSPGALKVRAHRGYQALRARLQRG